MQVTNAPCGLTEAGYLRCWTSDAWPIPHRENDWAFLPIDTHQRFSKVVARDSGVVWGLDRLGVTRRVMCSATNTFESGPDTEAPWCDVPEAHVFDFVQIGKSHGLTHDGGLIHWRDGERPVHRYPQDRHYTLFSFGDGAAALDDENTLYYGGTYAAGPVATHSFEAQDTIEAISTWRILGACALLDTGLVRCFNADGEIHPPPFPATYQRLEGDLNGTCAQRDDHVVECNDGSIHDFGPLRHMAVSSHFTLDEDAPNGVSLQLCVLTEAGAIECVGERYAPDLQLALPTQDPLLPR